MKSSMTMRTKFLFFCLTCTLFGLVLESFLFQKVSSELIFEDATKESSVSLQFIQEDIDLYIEQMKGNLTGVYNERQLIQDLDSDKDYEKIRASSINYAHDITNTNFGPSDSVQALYVYDNEHRIISTYRHAIAAFFDYPVDIYDTTSENNAEDVRSYVDSARSSMFVDGFFSDVTGKNIVRSVLKIFGKHNYSNLIGYVVCDIDAKVFKNLMEKYARDPGIIMWLQEYGNPPIVTMGDIDEENEQLFFDDLSAKIENNELRRDESFITNGRIFFQAAQTRNDLRVFSLVPQNLLVENQKRLTLSVVAISILMIFIVSFLSFFFSRSVTKPLEKMMDTIKRIRKGETNLRIENPGNDELGLVSSSFNSLLDEMETLIRKEYQTKLLLRDVEYKALQAQINPHFLYNTLDTMSSIAMVSNCTIVSNLSLSLSHIFRYSLDMKNPLSTISSEIVHLNNYLYVMNVRMHGEIHCEFDIDDEVFQNMVPKISIQPVVENALNHGLKNKHGEKIINIIAKKHKEKLLILVIDNGMDAETMNEKLEKCDIEDIKAGNSIGLLNINARIKMLFGKEYGIHIESESEAEYAAFTGTRVYMWFPLNSPKEVK